MPARKTSDNVKSLRGTSKPSRTTGPTLDFDAVSDVPEAPEVLPIEAKQYWDRIVPILLSKRVLSIADLEALEVMCALYGRVKKYVMLGADINAATVTQLRMYQTEFGLTPASRNKIAAGEDVPEGNKFGKNGRRKRT